MILSTVFKGPSIYRMAWQIHNSTHPITHSVAIFLYFIYFEFDLCYRNWEHVRIFYKWFKGYRCGLDMSSVPLNCLCAVPLNCLCSVPLNCLCSVPLNCLCSVPLNCLCSVPLNCLCSVPCSVPLNCLCSVPFNCLCRWSDRYKAGWEVYPSKQFTKSWR